MGETRLYTNEMLAEMIENLIDTVDELIAVKGVVAQGIDTINVIPGAAKTLDLLNAQKTANATEVNVATFKSFSRGIVRVNASVKSASGASCSLKYSINDGASVTLLSFTETTFTSKTGSIPVNPGDKIAVTVLGTAGVLATVAANATISYDLVDIVNNNGFAVI